MASNNQSVPSSTIAFPSTTAASVILPAPVQGKKSGKFHRIDFKRWHDFSCRYYILNGLDNSLYNMYSAMKMTKELWELLDKKYHTKDVELKKFVIDFNNYFKQKRNEMGLEDLIVRIQIEENNRMTEIKTGRMEIEAKVILVKDCRLPKKNKQNQGKQNQTNITEEKIIPVDLSELNLSAIVFEANQINNSRE
ncbi:hypothetical protein CDL12_13876 [Handroanthus impetiginosus]|uniref:Uncharacterized protein n=1 Tax=Handroanthus impetiginosus TaxID=429701 RepID=A0A2G9H7P3_9LAMI|nr:hypothetical protein CDL12_13876 [Handroanthus impetiginosus]